MTDAPTTPLDDLEPPTIDEPAASARRTDGPRTRWAAIVWGLTFAAIAAAGYGDFFGHGTGHGVGFDIHESPTLSPRSQDKVLQIGQVVTVEPGIYQPGKFGVRIEDMAHLIDGGVENLTKSEKTLITL